MELLTRVTLIQKIRSEFKDRKKVLSCFEKATLQNRPAKEVATELGIDSVNTVYVYAHRVLQRAKQLCAEYDEELAEVSGLHPR